MSVEAERDVSDFIGGGGESTPTPLLKSMQHGLRPQTAADLDDIDSLGPDSHKVISRQATLNIGTIGHVAHGKSTLVNAISGVKTTRFETESVMNITIHLGYANAKIFACETCLDRAGDERLRRKRKEREERALARQAAQKQQAGDGELQEPPTTITSSSNQKKSNSRPNSRPSSRPSSRPTTPRSGGEGAGGEGSTKPVLVEDGTDLTEGACPSSGLMGKSGTNYYAFKSSHPDAAACPRCNNMMTLVRHVSFLDCPGHEILMATMLNGAAIMDAALLLIAANETFPQPQTREHLHAAEILELQSMLVLQNKIDLVPEAMAMAQYHDIKTYINGSPQMRNAPILPICAQLGYGLDVVLEHIAHFPIPRRNLKQSARMTIVRSFDINKPGEQIDRLQGGVVGGTVQQGILKTGQEVEIRPGVVYSSSSSAKDDDGGEGVEEGPAHGLSQSMCYPLKTVITNLQAEANQLRYAVPGGLIAVGTKLDPALTRQNHLAGQVLGEVGTLPEMFVEITAQYFLLSQLVGVPTSTSNTATKATAGMGGAMASGDGINNKNRFGVSRPSQGEALRVTIGAHTCAATVIMTRGELSKFALNQPVVCEIGKRFCISRMVLKQWRLIGWGTVTGGVPAKLYDPDQ